MRYEVQQLNKIAVSCDIIKVAYPLPILLYIIHHSIMALYVFCSYDGIDGLGGALSALPLYTNTM